MTYRWTFGTIEFFFLEIVFQNVFEKNEKKGIYLF
jgi:hypothetical protein